MSLIWLHHLAPRYDHVGLSDCGLWLVLHPVHMFLAGCQEAVTFSVYFFGVTTNAHRRFRR